MAYRVKVSHNRLYIVLLLLSDFRAQAQTISGNVHNELNSNIEGVAVSLTGPGVSMSMFTGNDGNFSFNGLPDNQTYRLCFSYDLNPLNSPYKIIAAETAAESNLPSATVDVLDLSNLSIPPQVRRPLK